MTEDIIKNNKKNRVVLIIVAVIMIVAYWNGQNLKDIENVDYGFWSIVPALTAVILAFITREAIFALLNL